MSGVKALEKGTIGYRIREAQMKKVPYLLVIGKNEANDNTVSYRLHGEQKTTTVPADEFVNMLKDEIASKTRRDK